MKKSFSKVLILFVFGTLVFSYFHFNLGQYLNRDFIKGYADKNAEATMAVYFIVYIIMAACSLPGAAAMTLIGGGVFGLAKGVVLVSFASTIGATLAFLASRYLLRDWVIETSKKRGFYQKVEEINKGVEKEGAEFLLALRLIPLFPFWLVNLVMGLTAMPAVKYYLVSQLGMLPGTIAFVNAGAELGKFKMTPGLFLSFTILGLLPFLLKTFLTKFKAWNYLRKYQRPAKFDYNLLVIGAGSAGLVTAYIAGAVKAKVGLIEKHRMGGDCLNTGCVPSKAIIKSGKILSYIKRCKEFGIHTATAQFNFSDVMSRVHNVIKKIEPHDSVERYTGLGVECISGAARVVSPYEVEVNGKILTTRNIVIASGAGPFVPPIKGINSIPFLTSDNLWELKEQPKRLIVLGGGSIGCELAQAFARLGSEVTQIEMGPRIMPREDEDVSAEIVERFHREGIRVLTSHLAEEVKGQILICDHNGKKVEVPFDRILVAVGRKANVEGLGLEKLGISFRPQGTIETNEYLQTACPTIFACGDVAGPYQFTHTAAHQAYYASTNALFGFLRMAKVDYRVIPWCTYTDPEVARVGLNEQEAKAKGIPYEVTKYGIDDLDRAIAESEDHGFVKVLTVPGKDKILGATIVGHHAGDIIVEYIAAMKHGFGLNKILGTIHIYPTFGESNKFAAGVWRRKQVSERSLKLLEGIHSWRRGNA